MKKTLTLLLLCFFVVSVSAQSITIPIQDGTTVIKVLECTDGLCHLGNEFNCSEKDTMNYDIMFSDTIKLEYYFDGNSDDVYEIQIQQLQKMEEESISPFFIMVPILFGLVAVLLWWVFVRKNSRK